MTPQECTMSFPRCSDFGHVIVTDLIPHMPHALR